MIKRNLSPMTLSMNQFYESNYLSISLKKSSKFKKFTYRDNNFN